MYLFTYVITFMGHVINPINFRLSYNRYWSSIWAVSDLKNYSHLTNQDLFIRKLVLSFFNQWNILSNNVIVSDLKILRKFSNLNLFIYIYDSSWEEFLNDFYYKFLEKYKFSTASRHLKSIIKQQRYRRSLSNDFVNYKKYKSNSSFDSKRRSYSIKNYIWENRSNLRNHMSLLNSKYTPLKTYKLYLKELYSFYVFYIRSRVQKPVYNYIKGVLVSYLHKFFFNIPQINIYFIGLTNNNITAAFLTKYLSVKLERSYFLFEILKTLNKSLKLLMAKRILQGYRIKFSGRYSRKQMAVALINGFGSFARSAIETRLDYSFATARLRFSSCGIKVWLAFSSKVGFLHKMRKSKIYNANCRISNFNYSRKVISKKFSQSPLSFLII